MTSTMIDPRQAWLEQRRSGIGGSDAPAVLGVDPWRDPLTIWSQKVGLLESEDLSDNEAVQAGIELERPIAEWYGRKFGRHVQMNEPYRIRRHPTHEFMIATLDAIEDRDGEMVVVQVKNTSAPAETWEEALPTHYEVQLQHEMLVAGASRGVLVALHRGQSLRAYERVLCPSMADEIIEAERQFWEMVKSETAPAAGPYSATTVRELFPRDEIQDAVPLLPEADDLDAELQDLKAKIDELAGRKGQVESQLKMWIGSHSAGVTPQGVKFSWKGSEVNYKPREASTAYVRRFTRSVKR